jgi:hypothetical protein
VKRCKCKPCRSSEAIIELGKGLSGHEPDFAAYRRRLVDEEKKARAVAAVAAGRRAHRLAFAMMRSQEPYDPERWRRSLVAGRPHARRGVKTQGRRRAGPAASTKGRPPEGR